MAVNSIAGQDAMTASNLSTAREYARENSSVDNTITTQSSYQGEAATDSSRGNNVDTTA